MADGDVVLAAESAAGTPLKRATVRGQRLLRICLRRPRVCPALRRECRLRLPALALRAIYELETTPRGRVLSGSFLCDALNAAAMRTAIEAGRKNSPPTQVSTTHARHIPTANTTKPRPDRAASRRPIAVAKAAPTTHANASGQAADEVARTVTAAPATTSATTSHSLLPRTSNQRFWPALSSIARTLRRPD